MCTEGFGFNLIGMTATSKMSTLDVCNAISQLTVEETRQLVFQMGVPLRVLDSIADEYTGENRKQHFVRKWLDMNLDASWDKLVAGLRKMNMNTLAASVESEVTAPVGPLAPVTATPAPVGPLAPVTATPAPVGPLAPVTATPAPVGPLAPATATPAPVGPLAPVTATPAPVGPLAPVTATPAPVGPLAPVAAPVGPLAPATATPAPVGPLAAPVTATPAPVGPLALTPAPVGPLAPAKAPVGPLAPITAPVSPLAPVTAPVGPRLVPVTAPPVAPVTAPVGPLAPATAPVSPLAPVTATPAPVGPLAPATAPVGPLAPATAPVGPLLAAVTAPVGPLATVTAPVGPLAPVTAPVGPLAPVTAPVGPLVPVTYTPAFICPISLPDNTGQTFEQRVAEAKDGVERLEEEFFNLKSDAQEYLLEKESQDPKIIRKFQDYLLEMPVAKRQIHIRFFTKNEEEILDTKTIRKLFVILGRYCNYSNYEIILHVVKKFCHELKGRMTSYRDSLVAFEKSTTVDIYLCAISARPGGKIMKEFINMTMKINKPASECSLYEIRELNESILEEAALEPCAMYIKITGECSVRVSLRIHEAMGWMVGVVLLNAEFRQEHLLTEVTVWRIEMNLMAYLVRNCFWTADLHLYIYAEL